MGVLNNKIDFAVLIAVKDANPNGDPLNGNRPRVTYDGYGEISDVCIKRKLRNRLQDAGKDIFVQSEERANDNCKSLSDRLKNFIGNEKLDHVTFASKVCEKWIDVRSFGQVFAFKAVETNDGVSVGIRGPVSIQQARSINPVDITSMQITKSVNSETTDSGKKSSDTMGSKHMVNFGLYVVRGAINVQLAQRTGFTDEDAEAIKEALRTLFVNDSSSARPDGSMEVIKLYWWKHNNQIGQYSSAKVQRTLHVQLKDGVETPSDVSDYDISLDNLEGLKAEEIQGM